MVNEFRAPTVVTRQAQPYVGIRCDVTMDTIHEAADRMPEVFGWLAERGIAPADYRPA